MLAFNFNYGINLLISAVFLDASSAKKDNLFY